VADAAARSVADDPATIQGFFAVGAFGIPVRLLIAGSRTVESYVYPLLVFSQSIPKIAIAPLFVVWFGFGMFPKVLSAFLLASFRWSFGRAGLQVGRARHDGSGARHGGEPAADFPHGEPAARHAGDLSPD